MSNEPEVDFIRVVLGRSVQESSPDRILGVGILLDEQGKQTTKILIRLQEGENGAITEGIFSISQTALFNQGIGEALLIATTRENEMLRGNK